MGPRTQNDTGLIPVNITVFAVSTANTLPSFFIKPWAPSHKVARHLIARLGVKILKSFWNIIGASAA